MQVTTPKRASLAAFADQQTVRELEGLFAAVADLLRRRRLVQFKAASYTVLPEESGTTFVATAADVEFTLPPTQAGLEYAFVFRVPSAGIGGQVSPAAADKIMGNGFTSADNKAAINTGATDREGDRIEVEGDGVDGWYIAGVVGTFAREP